jgi:DNA-binding response OmpR family regulator
MPSPIRAADVRPDIMLCTQDSQDRSMFETLAVQANWRIHHARDMGCAVSLLGKRIFRAVICDADQSGDLWRDILSVTADGTTQPRVIVMSRLADERLWAEVLNLGAYDLLVKPLDSAEARRVLTLATAT